MQQSTTSYEFSVQGVPGILMFQIVESEGVFAYEYTDLPHAQTIKGVKYNVFAFTKVKNPIAKVTHFFTMFQGSKPKLMYDWTQSGKLHNFTSSNDRIVWLVRAEKQSCMTAVP
jgi:hypothetical protein